MISLSQNDYLLELRNLFDRLHHMSAGKATDYSGTENTFKNFNLVEVLTNGRLTCEDGIFTRLSDKVARIGNLLSNGNVRNNESIEDNLDDLIVYGAILKIALQKRRKNGNGTKTQLPSTTE